MSVLDKVRRWIDGESAEMVLEQAARDAQVKPRSHSEEFIVKIARAVEEVMQREMVPLPQGTTIIPTEYTIFLSNDDDKEWQGIKRKGLEQGLYHILAERAKEISGKKKLETKTFVVELRVDGTIEKGDVRVQHSWEDSSGNKTGVLSRPKNLPDTLSAPKQSNHPIQDVVAPNQFPPNNYIPPTAPNFVQTKAEQPALPTVPQLNVSQILNEEAEEMTHIQKRQNELYKLEIWRGGVRQNVVPIYSNEISVGRGSKTKPVDVPLGGDPEISRRHLTISTDGNGNYWLVNEGKNPAAINNYDLPQGQRINVSPGVPIVVCSYLIRIQPKS
ncbi:MAG: FHA domain-containing protein [Pyrinomonadaceae bacterium]|nr:FHA domain-containing protein [Pyrinomonadaceae bacterium]